MSSLRVGLPAHKLDVRTRLAASNGAFPGNWRRGRVAEGWGRLAVSVEGKGGWSEPRDGGGAAGQGLASLWL